MFLWMAGLDCLVGNIDIESGSKNDLSKLKIE